MLIAQITDTHVTRDGQQSRYLEEALAWIDARQPRPTVILLSGDTVHAGLPEEYALLRDVLRRCTIPVYVVPGNHDARGPLRAALPAAHFPGSSTDRIQYALDAYPVRLIGLDTTAHNTIGGSFDGASHAWLDARLREAPERPTLIFMHHPPFRTGVRAADMFGFSGRHDFARAVAAHAQVRRIISGHIHCERRTHIAQAVASTSVSTAPQRVPEIFEQHPLRLRREPPGFTLHTWENGGFSAATYINAGAGRFVQRGSVSPTA